EQNKDVFMREFHENHSDSFFDKPFKAVNYLFNEELYSRIKQAALEKRIDIRQAGLTDSEFIKGLGAQLEKSGLLLSVLDISNAWENMYIPRKSFREAILQYAKLGGSDSLLLMTGVSFASQFRDSILEMYSWGYFALSFPVAERIHRSCWATRLYRFSLLLTKSGINGLPWFFHKSPIGGSRCSQSVAQ
ncbi:MAG: hypothetical protein KDD61_14290, partial [Bdellovibrionales bacterium]|nr:hypothetical protein [Bdellovibrionales bacterium]